MKQSVSRKPYFMEPEGFLQYIHEPSTGPYSVPEHLSSYRLSYLSKIDFNIILRPTSWFS
jgi:hypothetical protein